MSSLNYLGLIYSYIKLVGTGLGAQRRTWDTGYGAENASISIIMLHHHFCVLKTEEGYSADTYSWRYMSATHNISRGGAEEYEGIR